MGIDIYLYGTTVASTIHRLDGAFPALDTYGEIASTWKVPGGEAMNAAMVLGRFGLRTRIAGPRLGTESGPLVRRYAARYGIEVGLVDEGTDWPGLQDLILVDDDHRTVFGSFGHYYSDPVRRWDRPEAEILAGAKLACIDPWFPLGSDEAARICVGSGVPYVTIDCEPESFLAAHAAAVVVSGEFRRTLDPGLGDDRLLARYQKSTQGLVVFTSGAEGARFGREGQGPRNQAPFPVRAVSTLGAGDVFRAGIAWGLFQRKDDASTVRFASGLAALCCTRMPIADTVPSLDEAEGFVQGRRP